MTARRTWQIREQSAAALFGAKRQVLSGSSGRDDATQSDSTHPRLFIECKLKAKQAVRSLWRATALLAAKEHKVAVLILYEKSKPGGLIVIHEDDLDAIIEERIKAREEDA
jgi:hypothetical protein